MSMKPQASLATIDSNKEKISEFLMEMIVEPRINAIKWSNITRQTPNIKIGYPGQHLASLITGMPGEVTGARGNDLIDGTEVKSCSRIDQSDKCKNCGNNLTRLETVCGHCGSDKIKRNNDSKWLFTIRSEADLDTLTNKVDRVLLLLADYPNFSSQDFSTLRIQSFEIWTKSQRNKNFRLLIENYYKNIYQQHRTLDTNKVPAPKNFWPESYQFYLCNPIKTFECWIHDSLTKPKIDIRHYIEPTEDRASIPSEPMPYKLLNPDEKSILKLSEPGTEYLVEEMINKLGLRADRIASAKETYSRRKF